MYQVGDLIIYGNHGVCRVENVGRLEYLGIDKKKLYYTLSLLYHNEKVFTPVDTTIVMRPVISCDEAKKLLSLIPTIKEDVFCNRNIRLIEVHYQEYLHTYDCYELLKMIKSIYKKRAIMVGQGKRLGQIDERFLSKAEELLCGELAVALNKTRQDVRSFIEEKVKEADNIYLMKS